MTKEEAKRKLEFFKKAYQKLIDEKVDSGKLVGDGVRCEWKAGTSLDEVYKDAIKELDMAIKALEKMPEWIPVSERLPKAGEYIGDVAKYYLVQNEYGDMMVAHYAHSEYWEQMHQLGPIADDVVAWMPLPEPYKSESEVENAE